MDSSPCPPPITGLHMSPSAVSATVETFPLSSALSWESGCQRSVAPAGAASGTVDVASGPLPSSAVGSSLLVAAATVSVVLSSSPCSCEESCSAGPVMGETEVDSSAFGSVPVGSSASISEAATSFTASSAPSPSSNSGLSSVAPATIGTVISSCDAPDTMVGASGRISRPTGPTTSVFPPCPTLISELSGPVSVDAGTGLSKGSVADCSTGLESAPGSDGWTTASSSTCRSACCSALGSVGTGTSP